jgi:hypothetical protein
MQFSGWIYVEIMEFLFASSEKERQRIIKLVEQRLKNAV